MAEALARAAQEAGEARFLSEVRAQLAAVGAWGPKPSIAQISPALRNLMSMQARLDSLCDPDTHVVPAGAEALLDQCVKTIARLIGLAAPRAVTLGFEQATLIPPESSPAAQRAVGASLPSLATGSPCATKSTAAAAPPPAVLSPTADSENAASEGSAKKHHHKKHKDHKERREHKDHKKAKSPTRQQQQPEEPSIAASAPAPERAAPAKPEPDDARGGSEESWSAAEHPEIASHEIKYDPVRDLIGEGAFGRVFRARVRGQVVAAKVPRKQDLTEHQLRSFRHEVTIMRRVNNPNVVMFLGACTEPGRLIIVTELMTCDLESVIHGPRFASLSLTDKLHMALDAAMGMNWLHGICNIAHRDLKPANLLLDENNRVHVSDFGFSEIIRSGHKIRDIDRVKGTALYAAPEVLANGTLDFSVDVYSFGLILWELMTGQYAFSNFSELQPFVAAVVGRNERPDLRGVPPPVANLIQLCWDASPEKRPTFAVVARSLEEIIVEACLGGEAVEFWKKYFLNPLLEAVPWSRFRSVLMSEFKLPSAFEGKFESEKLLRTLPLDHDESKNPDPDWYGLPGLFCHTERKDMPVTMEKLEQFRRWFGGFSRDHILAADRLASQQWFHGCIDKSVAADRLRLRPDGHFLVRASVTVPDSPFTLSTIVQMQISHFRVSRFYRDGKPYLMVGTIVQEGTDVSSLCQLIARMQEEGVIKKPCPRTPIPY
eukprot:m51a1_g6681 putative sh2 domain-containing protein (716) ;mRNA; r:229016-231341